MAYKMKELSEQQKEKLSRILAKGNWRYVILYGVVMWGVMTAILFRVLMIYWKGNEEPFWGQFLSAETVFALIIFPIVGIGFGLAMWKVMQKTARKHGLLK
jgi:magnesium-transporting ATPase (P-type)